MRRRSTCSRHSDMVAGASHKNHVVRAALRDANLQGPNPGPWQRRGHRGRRQDMDIQDISIFSRVAAVQNLTAVGNALGLTPGTISKRIQALEDELGVRLFDRTTRSIRITPEGESFLAHVQRILAEFEAARAAVADSAARPKGRLRIAASRAIADSHVTPAITAFLRAFPEVDAHVDLTDQVPNLQEEGYDVAIHVGTLVDSPLIAKRLANDRLVTVAAPAYLAEAGRPERPEDLALHPALVLGDTSTWLMQRGQDETAVKLQVRLRSDTLAVLKAAAVAGLGIMRVPAWTVRDEIAAKQLAVVLPEYDRAATAGVWALYASGRHVAPRLRAFVDFISDWFRERPVPALARAGRGR